MEAMRIREEGIPARDFVLHFQEHTLHAIGQRGFGESAKVFKGLHQTADHRRGITALDEGDKAHARVAEDRGKPVDLARRSVLLILKLAPIELDLFSWLGFIAHHGIVPSSRGTQGMDKGFEHTQASCVAHR